MTRPTTTAHCRNCDAPLTRRADWKWIHTDTRRVYCAPGIVYQGKAVPGYYATRPGCA